MATKVVKAESPKPAMGEIGAIGSIADIIKTVQNDILDYRGVSVEQMVFMCRNDGQAKGIINAIKNPIKMARAKITEAEGGKAEAEFIRKNLLLPSEEGGMSTHLSQVAATMAVAARDGYKIFEKVWDIHDDQIWLKKLAYRSTLCTTFTYDNHGNITGAKEKAYLDSGLQDITLPLEKIAYFMYNAEENPLVGESDFYPVFYHYDKKHKLYAIAHLAYQLNAVPIRMGTHPKNFTGKPLEDFRTGLQGLGTKVAMTFPDVCKVEKFESDRRLTEFLYLIRHHDGMMSRAFLTQFLNLGQEGSGGSFALSSSQSDLFLMAIIGLLNEISRVFNTQVIPQLIDWNFGTKKYPKLVFSPFSDAIRSVIMETFRALLAARFPNISPEFALALEHAVSDELGLPLNYEEIKARVEAEREALMKAEAAAAGKGGRDTNIDADDEEDLKAMGRGGQKTE